jgi:hypothetical protein
MAFHSDQADWSLNVPAREMIGPVFENHFGIIFRFPVNLIADLQYDSSKWR